MALRDIRKRLFLAKDDRVFKVANTYQNDQVLRLESETRTEKNKTVSGQRINIRQLREKALFLENRLREAVGRRDPIKVGELTRALQETLEVLRSVETRLE